MNIQAEEGKEYTDRARRSITKINILILVKNIRIFRHISLNHIMEGKKRSRKTQEKTER
jgi:hypothetical protein